MVQKIDEITKENNNVFSFSDVSLKDISLNITLVFSSIESIEPEKFSISLFTILPPSPEPETSDKLTPLSEANFFARGETFILCFYRRFGILIDSNILF